MAGGRDGVAAAPRLLAAGQASAPSSHARAQQRHLTLSTVRVAAKSSASKGSV